MHVLKILDLIKLVVHTCIVICQTDFKYSKNYLSVADVI